MIVSQVPQGSFVNGVSAHKTRSSFCMVRQLLTGDLLMSTPTCHLSKSVPVRKAWLLSWLWEAWRCTLSVCVVNDACCGGDECARQRRSCCGGDAYRGSFASAVAVQAKRMADAIAVGSLAMHVAGGRSDVLDDACCGGDECARQRMSRVSFASAATVLFCCGDGICGICRRQ